MSIASIVRSVIDEAEAAGRSMTALDVEQLVYADHPNEVESEAVSLMRGRIRDLAQRQLSGRARSCTQETLPGFELPRMLVSSLDDGDALRYIPVRTAAVGDLDAHIGVRQVNLDNCRAEVRKLRALRRRVADADPATNLVSALAGAR